MKSNISNLTDTINNKITLNVTTKAIATIFISIAILISNTINIHAEGQQGANKPIQTVKHQVIESIMYCTSSELLKLSDISEEYKQTLNITNDVYLSTLQDENGEEYYIYSDDNIYNNWFVCIVDTMNTKDIQDDEILNTYLLDDYIFAE